MPDPVTLSEAERKALFALMVPHGVRLYCGGPEDYMGEQLAAFVRRALAAVPRLAAPAGEREAAGALDNAGPEVEGILKLANRREHLWRNRPDHYWFARLSEEVGELASSLVGNHADSPEHELRQIGSIAINWLRLRVRGERTPPATPPDGSET